MKKTIAFVYAIIICMGAVSCGEKKQDKPQEFTAEKLSSAAYTKSSVELPDEIRQIYCFEPYNGGQNYFILGTGDTTPEFWTTGNSFDSFEKLEIPEFDIGANYDIDVTDDGTVVEFLIDVDYGDLPDPDPTAEDYNAALYESAAEYSFAVNTYSVDSGELLSTAAVSGFSEEADASTAINGVFSDGQTVIVSIGGSYEIFSVGGEYICELGVGDGEYIKKVGRNSSGALICAVETSEDKMQIREIGADGKLGESAVTYNFDESLMREILPGNGGYSAFLTSRTTIYGIKSEDSSIEPLFDITASGVDFSTMQGFSMGEDGIFSIVENNYSNFSVKMRRFTPVDPEELANMPVVTIGFMYTPSQYILDDIEAFNESHSDFRVEAKIYNTSDANSESEYIAASDAANERFKQDILSDNLPDILSTNRSNMTFGSVYMGDKDAFCDLYEFMDKDSEVTRDTFVPSLLSAAEDNGHLYALANSFRIQLGYAAKTKYLPDSDLDFDSYMDILENMPDGIFRFNYQETDTKYSRLGVLSWTDWIDYENGTCHFDSDSFIRFLNFCNEPAIISEEELYTGEEAAAYWESRSNYTTQQRQYMDDISMFSSAYLGGYSDYLTETKGEFGGEPINFTGNISPYNSNTKAVMYMTGDCYSITKSSPNKELAWEFVREIYTDDYYKNCLESLWGLYGFPSTKNGLEMLAEHEKQPKSYEGYFIEDISDYTGYIYDCGDEILRLGNVTDDIINIVNGYIDIAVSETYGSFMAIDLDEFYNISYEEMDRFFYGECTAEECAEAMQSRLSIMLAEKR